MEVCSVPSFISVTASEAKSIWALVFALSNSFLLGKQELLAKKQAEQLLAKKQAEQCRKRKREQEEALLAKRPAWKVQLDERVAERERKKEAEKEAKLLELFEEKEAKLVAKMLERTKKEEEKEAKLVAKMLEQKKKDMKCRNEISLGRTSLSKSGKCSPTSTWNLYQVTIAGSLRQLQPISLMNDK